MEFPHDAVPASRSDDNRRADGGLPDFQQFKISCLLKIFGTMADVREALCFFLVFCGLKFSYYYRSFSCFLTTIFSMRFSVARSAFTTAAAAGAVCIILNQRLVSSLNPQDVVGPAARLFSVFSVFCGLKFRALSCLSWLLKTFGCGQQPLQVVSCLSWFNI